ncbi:hypothetical protein [Rhodococcus sp. IEGM 1318]|uniref:hypothetical protein n=1 Tax=Rhodococcus sp. IEGM 1318 TaxID=3082226 RepID=UPI00295564D7|nr:hypothetical protein [Rhodococcus sp. IEGM 1318]MDV8008254.1 hypothetical protein [Rhodococcus sp. IEGM 1318]
MSKDLLTTLEKLRPTDSLSAEFWPENVQVAARIRIIATENNIGTPRVPRRRVGAVALVAMLCAAGMVGCAAATAMMPKPFTDMYSGWQTMPGTNGGIDPSTAERVGSVPGPDGTLFSVFVAHGADGWRCVAPVFEAPADIDKVGPSKFISLGHGCRSNDDLYGADSFGGGAGIMVAGPHEATYDAGAGGAVRAELHTADGEIYPTVLAEDRFYGWIPLSLTFPRPTLVGYAADGTVVGTR